MYGTLNFWNSVFYSLGAKRNRERSMFAITCSRLPLEPDSGTLRKSLAPRQHSLSLSLSLLGMFVLVISKVKHENVTRGCARKSKKMRSVPRRRNRSGCVC